MICKCCSCFNLWIFVVQVVSSEFFFQKKVFDLLSPQEKQARIASLYLPLYGLILDNMPRFFLRDLFPIYFTSSDQVSSTANAFQPPLVFERLCKVVFYHVFAEYRAFYASSLAIIHTHDAVWFPGLTLQFHCLCELLLLLNQTTS